MKINPNCQRCELHRWRTQVVNGDGPIPANIMLIGEAPGRDEDILGLPFVGRAGKVLVEALQKAGYERKAVYITNICKCKPVGNRPPRKEEADACIKYLFDEINEVKPKKIILMGRSAQRFFKHPGEYFFTVHNVYHPAYALHAPDMRDEVIRQLVEALG